MLDMIGCLNGGGQIKPKRGQSGKELIQNLESIYLQEVIFAVSVYLYFLPSLLWAKDPPRLWDHFLHPFV
jgi:iron only hydrogenase large subunit-like protein